MISNSAMPLGHHFLGVTNPYVNTTCNIVVNPELIKQFVFVSIMSTPVRAGRDYPMHPYDCPSQNLVNATPPTVLAGSFFKLCRCSYQGLKMCMIFDCDPRINFRRFFCLYLYCYGVGLVQHNTQGRERLSNTEGEPVCSSRLSLRALLLYSDGSTPLLF